MTVMMGFGSALCLKLKPENKFPSAKKSSVSPCELSTAVRMVIFFFCCRHFREIKEKMK